MRFIKLATIAFFLSLILLFNYCIADSIDMQVTPDKIPLGETLTVSYMLNSHFSGATPDFSPIERDFRIINTNYGRSINMVNGSISSQTYWRLTLTPKKAGELTIPAINFGKVQSEARTVVIQENANNNYVANDKPNSSVFIQAEISNPSPYVQSQVLYTFKLFYRSQLENPRVQLPQIKDATFFQLGDDLSYQTTIKGTPYNVVEKTFAFFPEKSGEIIIPPTQFSTVAYDVDTSLGNNPFYVASPKTIALMTKAFKLNVQKAPASYQGTTWLPAKNLIITEKWSSASNQWELGNPVTRTITVEAEGLRADQIPDIAIEKMTGINSYVDTPKRSNSIHGKLITGTLQQKVTYIPNAEQTFTIPGVKLHWWNMQTSANELVQSNPMTVTVIGAPATQIATPPSTITPTPVSANPTPITKPVEVKNSQAFYLSLWFWVAFFFFVIWLVTLTFLWKKKTKPIQKSNESSVALNDDVFRQACEQGNAALAQQYLLSWGKQHWQNTALNLEKLSEIINEDAFTHAIKNLEHSMYAKKAEKWDGHALLRAYLKIKAKKQRVTKQVDTYKNDPLPPLHP